MKRTSLPLAFLLIAAAPLLVFAADDGREDLDKATQLKLKANSIRDTEEVILLCESALEKGLNDDDKAFAEQLLVGALWQHAQYHSAPILEQQQFDRSWERLRAIATRDLEKLLRYDDEFADAYMMLAQLQALPNGDRTKAKLAIDRAIDLYADDARKRAESLLHRAAMRHDSADRLADLDAAIKTDPTYALALEMRARFFAGRGELEKAIGDLRKLLESDSDNVAIHLALAEAFSNLEKYDLALEYVDQAIELTPDQSRNYILRARIHEAMQEIETAIADLDKAIELKPNDTRPLLQRAQLYLQLDDFDSARADIDRIVRRDPTDMQALLLRSAIAESQGRNREAIADLEVVISANQDRVELQLHLAKLLMRDERPRKAIKLLTSIVELIGDKAEVYRTRADALLSVGNHADAIKDYEKALELRPNDDGVLNNLAWVLATSTFDELRDSQRSIELATRACEETNYELPHILSTLAAGYAEAGDFETAIKWATQAVEKGQTELKDQVEQLQQELESYKEGKPWRELQEIKEKPDPPRRVIET